jgi:RNA polymerase sporulation-specific sigma factor
MIEFIKKDRNIIISDETFDIYKKYLKVKDLLLNKYEKEPSIHGISLFMEIEEPKLISIIESVAFTHEMNIEYSDDNREKLDNKILIDSELNELDLFSKTLINYRYYQGLSQSETASLLGISQANVSRSEKTILLKLRNSII